MRQEIFAAAAIAVMAACAPAAAAPQPGEAAPAFTAMGADGKTVSLEEFRGRTVVLEWTNKGCPYVRKHYASGNMQRLQTAAREDGTVWLTLNSGAPGKQGHVDAAGAKAEQKEWNASADAYLLDHDGTVGRLYGASATPHMYVIDAEGTLRYMGAIDNRPTSDPADIEGATNHVAVALAALEAGEDVPVKATRAYGCTVKYAG